MDHLDDCPFCKSTDIGVSLRYDGLYIRDPERKHPGRYLAYAAVCGNCGARGPIVKVNEEYRAEERHFAVEGTATLWNRESIDRVSAEQRGKKYS